MDHDNESVSFLQTKALIMSLPLSCKPTLNIVNYELASDNVLIGVPPEI